MKLNKWVEYTTYCSICNSWGRDFGHNSQPLINKTYYVWGTNRKAVVEMAKKAGWKYIDGEVICPICFNKDKVNNV